MATMERVDNTKNKRGTGTGAGTNKGGIGPEAVVAMQVHTALTKVHTVKTVIALPVNPVVVLSVQMKMK